MISDDTIDEWPLERIGIECEVCRGETPTQCGKCGEPLCELGECIEAHIEQRHSA
jgi:hypothetical protein